MKISGFYSIVSQRARCYLFRATTRRVARVLERAHSGVDVPLELAVLYLLRASARHVRGVLERTNLAVGRPLQLATLDLTTTTRDVKRLFDERSGKGNGL